MTTITTYDSCRKRYLVEYAPSAEELPADHWTKTTTRTDAELEAEVDARLAARGIVQQSPTPAPTPVAQISSYDAHREQFMVEEGLEPKPDPDKVAAHNARRAESARRAKAERAAPTGPRPDEKEGWVPDGTTTGPVNSEATGPKIEWQPPINGRWVPGLSGVERFVPDPAPVFTPTVTRTAPAPERPKPQEVAGTLTGTSAIGMKTRPNFAPACGPAPVAWVDPAEKK